MTQTYNLAEEVFDWQAFHKDVSEWMELTGSTWFDMRLMSARNVKCRRLSRFEKGFGPPSLYVACCLAVTCDLSLDKYIIDRLAA